MRRFVAPLAVASVVLAVCASCGAPDVRTLPIAIPPTASDAQIAAVADGVADDDEYAAGLRAYVVCLTEAGFTAHRVERPDGVFVAEVPDAAVATGDETRCYDRHFAAIDGYWQYDNPPPTAEDERLRACLANAGLSTEGDVNELQERMTDHGLDIAECLDTKWWSE